MEVSSARECKAARTCRFPIFDDIAPKTRSRETPCLARCGAHAPADGRAMWAAVVYKVVVDWKDPAFF